MATDADNPLLIATDTANMQAGGLESILNNAYNFTGAALTSGIASIWNTGVDWFGPESAKIDVAQTLREYDSQMGLAYEQNKAAADTVGFVVTSLLPGGLALKGLQLAKAGTLIGPYGRALGFFSDKREAALKAALDELAISGGSIYTKINANKMRAMGWGVADQILQGAAFETAVALTMKQSPLLEKEDYKSIAWDIAKTAGAFGILGGGVEALLAHGVYKSASQAINAELHNYNRLRVLESERVGSVVDIPDGSKAYILLDSMLGLKKDAENLKFLHKNLSNEEAITLPTKEAFEKARENATAQGWLEFSKLANKMAGGDIAVGQQFHRMIEGRVAQLQKAGHSEEMILDELQYHLLNVKSLKRVDPKASKGIGDLFYAPEKLDITDVASVRTVDELMAKAFSKSPTSFTGGASPYEIIDKANLKIALVGDTTAASVGREFSRYADEQTAFLDGVDAVFLKNGTLKINPKSERIVPTPDPRVRPRAYFNVPTGSYSYSAFPTIADLASTAVPLQVVGGKNTVVAGTQVRKMSPWNEFKLGEIDTIDASSRYAWLAKKQADGETFVFAAIPNRIASTDLPMLERIYQEGVGKWQEVKLVGENGSSVKVGDISNFGDYLLNAKLSTLQKHLAENGAEDLLSMGVKLNVEVPWIQEAISSNFVASDALRTGFSVPLERSLYPANFEVRWDFSQGIKISKELTGAPTASKTSTIETVSGPKTVSIPKNANYVLLEQLPDGAGNTIYGKLGAEYAIKVGQNQANDAAASVLGGERYEKLPQFAQDFFKWLDQQGAGPTTVGAANADYGNPVKAAAQYIGQLTNIWIRENVNAALESVQSVAVKIRDNKTAAAELGILVNALRRTPEKFIINPEDSSMLVNVLAMKKGEDGIRRFDAELARALEQQNKEAAFKMQNSDVIDFITRYSELNGKWIDNRKVLLASRGMNHNWDPAVVHVPPVDTARYPYIAFVREKSGKLGASSETTMLTARSEEDLRKLMEKIPPEYDVITKKAAEDFYKAKGTYDYSLTINEPAVNSNLQKSGVLASYFPEVRAENIIEDFIRHIQNQESRIVRMAIETKYAQPFAEIRSFGKRYEQIGTSKAEGKAFISQVENPYEEIIKMALDISKRSEYQLLHTANEFVEGLGKTAYRAWSKAWEDAQSKTIVSWQEANRIAEQYGIKGPYSADNVAQYLIANAPADKNLAREAVAKANMAMVNFTLRLDFVQSLVNAISTPILLATEMSSIRSMVANDNVLAGKLLELRTIAVPGMEARVPSTTPLIASAIRNFWSEGKAELLTRYKDIGAIKDMMSKYHEMIDDFSVKNFQKVSDFSAAATKGIDKAAKWTGNTWSEEFTRFVSADVMRQITDPIVAAGKMTLPEQNSYISIFVNRVQGNYLASQRPVAFQGVIGAAISLFQTYQFNLLQQLFRHVENGDKKTISVMLGMQGGLYGANGIPFFEAANNYLIGQSSLNPAHRDVYSTTASVSSAVTGSTAIGNWMLYGTASAFPFWPSNAPALYTRGDINPRHPTVLPITPGDVVAVDGSIRLIGNLLDVGKKLVAGADVSGALLEGLEHNGINRPLAGMAQVFAGRTTTSKGGLISASNDLMSIATLARVAGAKPMDESLALNTYFRLHGYMAADQQRLENLGEAVKTKLRKNQLPTEQELGEFQEAYARAGGRIENYSKALLRWSKDANTSIVNKMIQQHQSQYSKRMIEIMGGTTLPDYRTPAGAGRAFTPAEPATEEEAL